MTPNAEALSGTTAITWSVTPEFEDQHDPEADLDDWILEVQYHDETIRCVVFVTTAPSQPIG